MGDKKPKKLGEGRVFVRKLIDGEKGFDYRFLKNDLVGFERMEDKQGVYFRVFPRLENHLLPNRIKYDHCRTNVFNKMFSIESEREVDGE